jgi:hypothetical protein
VTQLKATGAIIARRQTSPRAWKRTSELAVTADLEAAMATNQDDSPWCWIQKKTR